MLDPLDRCAPGLPEELSALVDGELCPQDVVRVAEHWRKHAHARADWHAFHLIGDVLRSEDLASTPTHDAQFLSSLRERLALEPVVLASMPVLPRQATRSTRPWLWSWAAAFGVVMIGAALWPGPTTRPAGNPGLISSLPLAPAAPGSAWPEAGFPETSVGVRARQGNLLRDAQIDRYLAAHQQFVGTSALGGPSGFVRNVAVDGPSRR